MEPKPSLADGESQIRPAAHELRNHLQSLLALTDTAETRLANRAARRWLGQLRAATEALRDVADDWLGVDKGPVQFDPRRLLRGLVAAHAPEAGRKALALECKMAPGCPARVLGDRRAYRTLVGNLVGNAIKFTSSGKVAVRLSGRRIGVLAALRLEVSDTGPGLPRRAEDDLRALGAASRARGGSGLGLRLASEAARSLGGSLVARPARDGGARFMANLVVPRGSDRRQAGGTGLRILVVEDHPTNRVFATRCLRAEGHRVRCAGDATAALRLAQRGDFDVALVDLGLPGLPGVELAHRLSRLQPGLHLVAWTGETGPADPVFATRLAKPCGGGALAAAAVRAGEAEDAGFATEARRHLRRQATRDSAALEAASRSGDAGAMTAAAHRVCGALALAGLHRLATLARQAEREAQAGRTGRAARTLGKVSVGLRRLGTGLT